MTSRIFIDANIPIYSGGRPHPLREPARAVLRFAAEAHGSFFTDAEVLQELLHYLSVRAGDAGLDHVRDFAELMRGNTEPVLSSDVELATEFSGALAGLQSRDLLHLAVMRRLGVTRIVSADRAFDAIPGVERLDPLRFEEWRDSADS